MTTPTFNVPSPDLGGDLSTARVVRVYIDGTVDVDLGAGRIAHAPVLDPYEPRSGRPVRVLHTGGAWLVLGEARTANAATQTVRTRTRIPYNVKPSTAAVANPLVALTTDTGSWRSADGWSAGYLPTSDAVAQGAWSSSELGFYRGCYFYGSAFDALAGRRSGTPTIRLSRAGAGGSSGATSQWLALHAHKTRPDGEPVFVTGAINVGSLTWGTNGDFNLPQEWGQMLLDGRAGGVGHLLSAIGSGSYSICNGRGTYAASGRLTIPWS